MILSPAQKSAAALGKRPERLCAVGSPGAFALALALAWAPACKPPPPPPPPPPPAAATIDGEQLLLSRLQTELDRLRRVTDASVPAQPPAAQGRALLDQLIEQRLVVARARKDRLLVSDVDTQRDLDTLGEAARAAGQTLKESLAAEGSTEEALTQEIRERLLAERWLSLQLKVERPGPPELKAAYDKLLKDSHGAPDAQTVVVSVPEQVRCAQILVASVAEAKAVLDQARKGTAFEQLARKYSSSPDKDQGGDLGFFSRGSLPPPFDDCFALQKNQLSGVLASKYGFHLLKLLERRPARRRTLAEVTPALEKQLVSERRTLAERALLESLRKAAKIEIHEDVLQELH